MIGYVIGYAWLWLFHPTFWQYDNITRKHFMGSWKYLR